MLNDTDRIHWRRQLLNTPGGQQWLLHCTRLYGFRERLLSPEHLGLPASIAKHMHNQSNHKFNRWGVCTKCKSGLGDPNLPPCGLLAWEIEYIYHSYEEQDCLDCVFFGTADVPHTTTWYADSEEDLRERFDTEWNHENMEYIGYYELKTFKRALPAWMTILQSNYIALDS